MAYDSDGLVKINQSLATFGTDFGANVWLYKSADTVTAIRADADYIVDAEDKGMQINDVIIVIDTTTPAVTVSLAEAIAADGSTTVL